jgi:hypothetical protein
LIFRAGRRGGREAGKLGGSEAGRLGGWEAGKLGGRETLKLATTIPKKMVEYSLFNIRYSPFQSFSAD